MSETTQQLAPQGVRPIAALTVPLERIQHAIAVNLGARPQLAPTDFIRLTVPTGGGTAWATETLAGVQQESRLEGVIVVVRDVRTYWKRAFGASEKAPPDCFSSNGYTGVGDPGGDCFRCPLNEFGSKTGTDGQATRGKACREGRQMFLLRGDSFIPELLNLPPTSLTDSRRYLLKLGGQGLPHYSVVTGVTLERTKNSGGVNYSEARFSMVRRLDDAEAAKAAQLHDFFSALMERVGVETVSDPAEA